MASRVHPLWRWGEYLGARVGGLRLIDPVRGQDTRRAKTSRLRSRVVLILLATTMAPFVLGVGFLIPLVLVALTTSNSGKIANEVWSEERLLEVRRNELDSGSIAWLERDLIQKRAALARSRAADLSLILKLMPVTSGA